MTRIFRPLGWRRSGYKLPEKECAAASAFEELWAKIFRIYTIFFLVIIITFQLYGVIAGLSGALIIIYLYYRSFTKTFAHYPTADPDQKYSFFSDYIRSRASAMSYSRLIINLVIGVVFFVYFCTLILSPDASFVMRYFGSVAGAIFGLAGITDSTVKLTTKIKYHL